MFLLIIANKQDLATINDLSEQVRGPIAESLGRLLCASLVEWFFAEKLKRGYGDVINLPRTEPKDS